jgi:hypothetical protein
MINTTNSSKCLTSYYNLQFLISYWQKVDD